MWVGSRVLLMTTPPIHWDLGRECCWVASVHLPICPIETGRPLEEKEISSLYNSKPLKFVKWPWKHQPRPDYTEYRTLTSLRMLHEGRRRWITNVSLSLIKGRERMMSIQSGSVRLKHHLDPATMVTGLCLDKRPCEWIWRALMKPYETHRVHPKQGSEGNV